MSASSKNDEQMRIWTYTITLAASVINASLPPENSENLSWDAVIKFADTHSILNIISYAAESLNVKPDDDTMKYLREFRKQKMVVEAQQEIEALDAMDVLEAMKVRHMPLKGLIIKNIYPSPDMRTMGDVDILIDSARCGEVIDAFCADGFTFCGEGDLHSNVQRGNVYIEFHRSMVDENLDKLNSYFGDGFCRAKKEEGFSYRYKLSNEDMYIFLIAHIAKHYRNGGTGIRTLLDIYTFRKAYPNLDYKYIQSEIKKMGLNVFAIKMEKLADKWFGGNFDGSFDNISEYIALCGVYGTKENQYQNEFIFENISADSFSDEKSKRVANIFFPKSDIMSIRYPIIKKHKWLTPLFWLIRVFDTLIHEPKNAKGRFQESAEIIKIDEKRIDVQRDSGIDKL